MTTLSQRLRKLENAIAKNESYQDLPSPQDGKQTQFYNCDADIVFYGGAAGAGKSVSLLLDCAKPQYLNNPNYNAVIFRKTYPELSNPGGLIDESQKLYQGINGSLTYNPLDWKFASGAKITFRHMQHEKTVYQYQGSQINRLCFDELSHFTESSFFYLLSRNRSISGIKPQVRATMNPDPNSWIAKFIQWWIDPVTGYPLEEKSGVIRYFIRWQNEIVWADNLDEFKRFGEVYPKSFTFISANIFDNPILLKANPEYLANLSALHPVEKERLLHGNWKIRYEAGLVFDRNWFKIVDKLPEIPVRQIRFWDMAATAKEVAGKSACYTAGVLVAQVDKDFYVLDAFVAQKRAGEVEAVISNMSVLDGYKVAVRWEIEGGSSGLIVEEKLKDDLIERLPTLDCKGVRPMGDKLTRALPVAEAAARGEIYLIRGTWNYQLLSACESFDGSSKALPPTNDLVDAFSGAYNALISETSYHGGEAANVGTGVSDIRARPLDMRRQSKAPTRYNSRSF